MTIDGKYKWILFRDICFKMLLIQNYPLPPPSNPHI